MTKTRTVAGRELNLTAGVRYYASRPAASRGREEYPVTIKQWGEVEPSIVVDGLSYEDANNLVNAFNNEAMSFNGRIW